jgi:UDP-glucose 4-epimerase
VKLLEGETIHIPKRPGEPDCTMADIARIQKVLGWQPQVPFEEGVQIVLQNIDYWSDAPCWTAETIAEASPEWSECLTKR